MYMNEAGKWENVQPKRIVGSRDSMFGISVKNIGDVNQDGYPGKKMWYNLVIHK